MNPDHGMTDWCEANHRYLAAALAELRAMLEEQLARGKGVPEASERRQAGDADSLEAIAAAMPAPPALETLCHVFALSPFERQILLLCAGVELDSAIADLCAAAHADARHADPTFSFALAALPEAHWSALSPGRPLRRWRLIEPGTGETLTRSPLRIDERVLHYLTGVEHLDERLVGYVEPVEEPAELAPSQCDVVQQIAETWSSVDANKRLPVIQLNGDDQAAQKAVAYAACSRLGLNLHVMSACDVPVEPRERSALMRLWERESVLSDTALLLDCTDLDGSDASRARAVDHLVEGLHATLLVASRDQLAIRQRPMVSYDVHRPTAIEQRDAWEAVLRPAAAGCNGRIDQIISQFNLTTSAIRSVAAEALTSTSVSELHDAEALGRTLWHSARRHTRPRLSRLAQRIESLATWDDLVLPDSQRQLLREIPIQVRQRMKVYETWGFAAKNSRGLGITALFCGPSGVGKTMAAELLANELELDLYRIDLSQVVSKYVGETEKNLRQVFDAAEGSGAILLFDEADALFGKRSEVKDSHDRYANIEIGYLLQRMEQYRGLAILTTNMKESLDQAFLRRIRFTVPFPFPDASSRAEIWRRIFPADTPTAGLDLSKLARLNVAGGNISNIAIHAAFLAAEAGEPVRMHHLHRAAQVEYAKLEKPLTQGEVGGWV